MNVPTYTGRVKEWIRTHLYLFLSAAGPVAYWLFGGFNPAAKWQEMKRFVAIGALLLPILAAWVAPTWLDAVRNFSTSLMLTILFDVLVPEKTATGAAVARRPLIVMGMAYVASLLMFVQPRDGQLQGNKLGVGRRARFVS